MTLDKRPFGRTGFKTSLIGLGAAQIGDESLSDHTVETLLNEVLDLGINLIDTARGYGVSEDRIGRMVSHRRDEYILSTKVGYSVEGYPDWTYDTIIAGVDQARKRLNSDMLDIVHLHSCPRQTMIEQGLLDALQETIQRGWVTIAAYSGENEDLAFGIDSGKIGSLQTSVNLFDQRDIDTSLTQARAAGIGIIAKRTIGNAPWRFDKRPVNHYCEPYWERMHAMGLTFDLPMLEVALRFAVFSANVDCAIVGTTNIDHLRQNVAVLEKGPLPAEVVETIRRRFKEEDHDWTGQI